jgi:single-strand DNA-binding protein
VARGLNKIQIIGNLGRDPEMRYTPNGVATTTFSVAVNRGRRGKDGQVVEETEWFRVITWDRLAETVDQYLKKGARVYVEGRLQTRKYIGNDGVERTAVEIMANDLITLSLQEKAEQTASQAKNGKARTGVAKREWSPEEEFFGELDDLPF